MGKIVVAGSLNMDLSVRVDHIPAAGETILGGDLLPSPGGKGANQAYAAAKLARQSEVSLLGCVGQDDFGREMLNHLSLAGCDISHVNHLAGASGVALIVVSTAGENAIVVAPGANALYSADLAEKSFALLEGADALLLQLEIPFDTVLALAAGAKERGVRVILDPAPAPVSLPQNLYKLATILTPNEGEAQMLTGIQGKKITPESAIQMGERLTSKGCESVILKLGSRGCLLYEQGQPTFLPAPKVETVDTTAAGDVFNGALAVALSEGENLNAACLFATRAAALSVTRKGAQLSAPTRAEVDAFQF